MSIRIEPKWEVNNDGTVKVQCIFKKETSSEQFSGYLPVRNPKYHWITVKDPITGEDIGEDLYLDDGIIELDNPQRYYVAWGVPPLVYIETGAVPVEVDINEDK